MGADVLETQGARASTTMIFAVLNQITRKLICQQIFDGFLGIQIPKIT